MDANLPPLSLLPWLRHQQSLTTKLDEEVGHASLQVLQQHWVSPNYWDRQQLQLASDWVMHREIVMWFERVPCWYARTILPQATYLHDHAFFQRLQQESLGKLIFDNARVRRISLSSYAIKPQSSEYSWLDETMHGHADELWVRLSKLILDEQCPFFLVEILLPGLEGLIT